MRARRVVLLLLAAAILAALVIFIPFPHRIDLTQPVLVFRNGDPSWGVRETTITIRGTYTSSFAGYFTYEGQISTPFISITDPSNHPHGLVTKYAGGPLLYFKGHGWFEYMYKPDGIMSSSCSIGRLFHSRNMSSLAIGLFGQGTEEAGLPPDLDNGLENMNTWMVTVPQGASREDAVAAASRLLQKSDYLKVMPRESWYPLT